MRTEPAHPAATAFNTRRPNVKRRSQSSPRTFFAANFFRTLPPMEQYRGTTILSVRRGSEVALGGDGQVTLG
ncbi:MAG TPA: hypothetical protein VF501_09265, partial [Thiobacillus sp.]